MHGAISKTTDAHGLAPDHAEDRAHGDHADCGRGRDQADVLSTGRPTGKKRSRRSLLKHTPPGFNCVVTDKRRKSKPRCGLTFCKQGRQRRQLHAVRTSGDGSVNAHVQGVFTRS
jgi:hypothetical protein